MLGLRQIVLCLLIGLFAVTQALLVVLQLDLLGAHLGVQALDVLLQKQLLSRTVRKLPLLLRAHLGLLAESGFHGLQLSLHHGQQVRRRVYNVLLLKSVLRLLVVADGLVVLEHVLQLLLQMRGALLQMGVVTHEGFQLFLLSSHLLALSPEVEV